MDEDLERLGREALIAEVRRLRQGIREHRDSSGLGLCWHHPQLWGLLPEIYRAMDGNGIDRNGPLRELVDRVGLQAAIVRRSLDRPLQGNAPWSKYQTSFTLMKGQVPDAAYLNLVINGKGTVWFKNIHLQHSP